MPSLIRFIGLLFYIIEGVLIVIFTYYKISNSQKLAKKQAWAKRIVSWLGIQIISDNELNVKQCVGKLLVSNHISWLDIIIFNSLTPMSFVAKSNVRAWPLIGWLAHKNFTIFIERGHSRATISAIAQIKKYIADGFVVTVFPEGTTTDGSEVGHFHSALFQSACDVDNPHDVLPITISYHLNHNNFSEHCTAPSYIGETSLIRSMWNVASTKNLIVCIQCADTINPKGNNRRELANNVHEVISDMLTKLG